MIPLATTVGIGFAAGAGLIESGGSAGGGTGVEGKRSAVMGGGGAGLCRKRPVRPPDIAGAGAPPVCVLWLAFSVGLTVIMIRLPSAFMV